MSKQINWSKSAQSVNRRTHRHCWLARCGELYELEGVKEYRSKDDSLYAEIQALRQSTHLSALLNS